MVDQIQDQTTTAMEVDAKFLSWPSAFFSGSFLISFMALLFWIIALPYSPFSRRKGLFTLGLLLLTTTSGWAMHRRHVAEDWVFAAVTSAETSARQGPGEKAPVSFVAHAGLYGRVLARKNGFTRLRLENGLETWIEEKALIYDGEPESIPSHQDFSPKKQN